MSSGARCTRQALEDMTVFPPALTLPVNISTLRPGLSNCTSTSRGATGTGERISIEIDAIRFSRENKWFANFVGQRRGRRPRMLGFWTPRACRERTAVELAWCGLTIERFRHGNPQELVVVLLLQTTSGIRVDTS